MLDLLRSLEWANVGPCCPSCERVKMDGHAPDCRLDRAIREMAEHPLRGFLLHEVRDGVAEYRGCVATSGMPAPVGTIAFTEHSPPEPTVDEMAREMGLTRGIYRNWTTNSDADLVQLETDGQWVWRPNGTLRDRDLRSWPTDTDAIRTLYREHKARHADPPDEELERVLGRSVTKEEEPPTDPAALAAWLFARVVPGVWAEWADSDGDPYGGPVAQKHFRDGRLWLWAGRDSSAIIMPPRGNIETSCRLVRLLNPDGTVLWEAK